MKYPPRGSSLKVIVTALNLSLTKAKAQAEKDYAVKIWDSYFDTCITHDSKECMGVDLLIHMNYGRCAPCEAAHKEWRDSKKEGFTTLKLSV